MHNRLLPALAIILLAAVATPAGAQEAPTLAPGSIVRLTLADSDSVIVSRFAGFDGEALVLDRGGSQPERVAPAEVERIEMLKREDRRASYALLGIAAGGGAGYLIYKAYLDDRYRDTEWNSIWAVLFGVPIGAAGGLIIGISAGREQWTTIPLEATAALTPASLQFVIRF